MGQSGIAGELKVDPRSLDPDAVNVVQHLRAGGFEAYLVGGCVRDLLLGEQPEDFDVVTSARPPEIQAQFSRSWVFGRSPPRVVVRFPDGKGIEVSTFHRSRTDFEAQRSTAQDAGGPAKLGEGGTDDVSTAEDLYGSTLQEDVSDRDFTVNGMYCDVRAGKVLDLVGGKRDLDQRIIRAIGDPEVVLDRDPVRLLRAVRLACRLSFDIEERTFEAMKGAVEKLPRCAHERVLQETLRIFRGGMSEPGLRLLSDANALRVLLPPVAERLAEGGADLQAEFYAHARALDQRQKTGAQWNDAMLLSALLLPLIRTSPAAKSRGKRATGLVDAFLSELVQKNPIPRVMGKRCRRLLTAQGILLGERTDRTALIFLSELQRDQAIFEDALALLELSVGVTNQGREALERWKSLD